MLTNILDELPMWIDSISSEGTVLYINKAQHLKLGFHSDSLIGKSASYIYSAEDCKIFSDLIRGHGTPDSDLLVLKIRDVQGHKIRVFAQFEIYEDELHGTCLRVYKFPSKEFDNKLKNLESDKEVLSSILTTARDASYCVEFLEPVDLTAPDHEVLRQVFENHCIWRYCNESMTQLCKLPLGEDLNTHDVREVFARSPENEAFIRQLMESGWRVDSAPSRDHRYDGSDAYVENDVRADIRRGHLLRFWGTVRNLDARQSRLRELESQVNLTSDILAALPDPVMVINNAGRIEAANPAVEWKLGWRMERILGISLDSLLSAGLPAQNFLEIARPPSFASARRGRVRCKDGRLLGCEVVLTEVGNNPDQKRCVVILRFPISLEDVEVPGREFRPPEESSPI